MPEDRPVDTGNFKQEARQLEQQGRFREALAMYRHVLTSVEGTPELLQELPLYVKAGDLYLKLDNPKAAVSLYERVGKIYAAHGSANSVNAICAKVLRVMPERTHIYRRLVGIMVEHGHVEAGREVMMQWTDRFRLTDTRGALERLSGRSDAELLPAMTMLLELAERVEAVEPEVLPELPAKRTTLAIAEVDFEPEPPAAPEAPPAEPAEAAGEAEADEEDAAPEVTDEAAADLPGPVLHAASGGENMEFRSERFGAESLAPPDEETETPAAPTDATDAQAPAEEEASAEVDDLLIVHGNLLPDDEAMQRAQALDQTATEDGGAARDEPSRETAERAGNASTDRRDEPASHPLRPVVLEPERRATPRSSQPRRSPVGSVLLAAARREEPKRDWRVWAGVGGAVVIVLILWLLLGLPPFGGGDPDLAAAAIDPAAGEDAQALDTVSPIAEGTASEAGTPSDTGLPAALEPNPELAVTPIGVPAVTDTARAPSIDSAAVIAVRDLPLGGVRSVLDGEAAGREVTQVLADGREIRVLSFPGTAGPSEALIDSVDGVTTARLAVAGFLVVVSGSLSVEEARTLVGRLGEHRSPTD